MSNKTYTTFKLYEEVFNPNFDTFTAEHHIMMGVMYNITSKGKHVLHKGVLSSSVNDILKQNLHRFNIEKKPKNSQWYSYLEELSSLGYLRRLKDVIGYSDRPNGRFEVKNPNYCITEEGMQLFKHTSKPSYDLTQLF